MIPSNPKGRPRDDAREQQILAAAVELLVEVGFGAMTIEGIAARAGAGKATVYRRWRNKAELMADAIRQHACAHIPLADTGDVRADIRAHLHGMVEAFAGLDGALTITFTAERLRYPELSEEFDKRFKAERRAHLERIVAAGVESGQLPPDTDVELLAEVGPALVLHALTSGRRPDGPLVDRILSQFFPTH